MKKTFSQNSSLFFSSMLIVLAVIASPMMHQDNVSADTFLEQTLNKISSLFTEKFPKPEHVKGIYMTVSTFTHETRREELVNQLLAAGGNAVTIDIEHSGGQLAFIPKNEQLRALNPGKDTIKLEEMVNYFHEKGIYISARNVVFNDPFMAKRKPEWRIKDKWGNFWGGEGNLWLDPSKPGAQNYNLMVIQELVNAGVDEVQLDYVRFPSTILRHLDFHFDEENFTRADIITDFVRKAHQVTQKANVVLAADVFGAIAFGNVDWKIVGQHIEQLAPYIDVLYPMTYPSHVNPGYYGYFDVWYEPYNFVHDSVEIFRTRSNKAADPDIEESEAVVTEIRPWVQGFAYKVVFNEDYVNRQVEATYDAEGTGYMIWNARNVYTPHSWPSFKIQPKAEEQNEQ